VITFRARHHKAITIKVSARASTATIAGLTAAIAWTIEVQAVNKSGRGLP